MTRQKNSPADLGNQRGQTNDKMTPPSECFAYEDSITQHPQNRQPGTHNFVKTDISEKSVLRFHIGVSRMAAGKEGYRKDKFEFGNSFHTEKHDARTLADLLTVAGYPVTMVHHRTGPDVTGAAARGVTTYRHKENFISQQVIFLDDDRAMPGVVDSWLSDPFFSAYGSFLYESASSRPEAQKVRPVFVLDQAITDPALLKEIQKAMMARWPHVDQGTHDVTRVWYGSPGAACHHLGNVLPLAVVEAEILEPYRAEMERVQAERAARAATAAANRTMSPPQPIDRDRTKAHVEKSVAGIFNFVASQTAGNRHGAILWAGRKIGALAMAPWAAPYIGNVEAGLLLACMANGYCDLYSDTEILRNFNDGRSMATDPAERPHFDTGAPVVSLAPVESWEPEPPDAETVYETPAPVFIDRYAPYRTPGLLDYLDGLNDSQKQRCNDCGRVNFKTRPTAETIIQRHYCYTCERCKVQDALNLERFLVERSLHEDLICFRVLAENKTPFRRKLHRLWNPDPSPSIVNVPMDIRPVKGGRAYDFIVNLGADNKHQKRTDGQRRLIEYVDNAAPLGEALRVEYWESFELLDRLNITPGRVMDWSLPVAGTRTHCKLSASAKGLRHYFKQYADGEFPPPSCVKCREPMALVNGYFICKPKKRKTPTGEEKTYSCGCKKPISVYHPSWVKFAGVNGLLLDRIHQKETELIGLTVYTIDPDRQHRETVERVIEEARITHLPETIDDMQEAIDSLHALVLRELLKRDVLFVVYKNLTYTTKETIPRLLADFRAKMLDQSVYEFEF